MLLLQCTDIMAVMGDIDTPGTQVNRKNTQTTGENTTCGVKARSEIEATYECFVVSPICPRTLPFLKPGKRVEWCTPEVDTAVIGKQ